MQNIIEFFNPYAALTKSKKAIAQALSEKLRLGELLLAFTEGFLINGSFEPNIYRVGLTNQRLILMQKGSKERLFSFDLAQIKHVSNESYLHHKDVYLRISFEGTSLVLNIPPGRRGLAREFVSHFQQIKNHPAAHSDDEMENLVKNLWDLRLISQAKAVMQPWSNSKQGEHGNTTYRLFRKKISESEFSNYCVEAFFLILMTFLIFRLGAVMWPSVVAHPILILLALLPLVIIVVMTAFILFAIKKGYGRPELATAVLSLVTAMELMILCLNYENVPGATMLGGFFAAVLLAFLGIKNRWFSTAAVVIFCLGVVLPYFFFYLGQFYYPTSWQNAVMGISRGTYINDFSTVKDWNIFSGERVTAEVAEGKYVFTLKAFEDRYQWTFLPRRTFDEGFLAHPQISFIPNQAKVEFILPEATIKPLYSTPIFYGLYCRYQNPITNADTYYRIEVTNVLEEFEVTKSTDLGRSGDILQMFNLPDGNSTMGGMSQLEMTCGQGQISLWINGVEYPSVYDPGLIPFYLTEIGFYGTAWDDDQIEFAVDHAEFHLVETKVK